MIGDFHRAGYPLRGRKPRLGPRIDTDDPVIRGCCDGWDLNVEG